MRDEMDYYLLADDAEDDSIVTDTQLSIALL